ncbi:hypothetical protein WBG99_33245 [Streptomyces sp. TG1A-60]
MTIVENVVSGLLVALIIWGARRVFQWRRRRIRCAAERETADS